MSANLDLDGTLADFDAAMANLQPDAAIQVLREVARGLIVGLVGMQNRVTRLEALGKRHLIEQHPGPNIHDISKRNGEQQ